MHLNPKFSFVGNRGLGLGYVVSRKGSRSVVNTDAMELLTSPDASWMEDPEYQAFRDQAVKSRWLTDEPSEHPASVRWIDTKNHLQSVQYEINLTCNLECAHCYCNASPRAPQGLPTEDVLRIVRQCAEAGVIYFDVTGGEPLIRKDCDTIIREIRRLGMIPSLHSNATLITPARARQLADAGVSEVQISLDAATAELHDELRGHKGAFERALRGIQNLKDVNVPVSVSVCLSRRNAHQILDIVDLFKNKLKVPFHLDRVIPAGRTLGHEQPLSLPNHEYYALMRKVFGPGSTLTKKACDTANSASRKGFIEPSCGVGSSLMFIKNDGRAALCPTLTEAESPAFKQADLAQMSVLEAWNTHPTFVSQRGMQCENISICPSGKECRGGCRSNAYLLHGSLDSPDEMYCNLNKNDSDVYVPMLEVYEDLRAQNKMPPRLAPRVPPAPSRRLLNVLP